MDARQAELVVESETLSVEVISSTTGEVPDEYVHKGGFWPGSVLRKPSRINRWSMVEHADNTTPLDDVIDRLFIRILPMKQGLIELRTAGCNIKLDLVQWISRSDQYGPGFALEPYKVEYLAEIGATVDVDQYLG